MFRFQNAMVLLLLTSNYFSERFINSLLVECLLKEVKSKMTNNDYQQIRPWLEGVLTTRGLPCKFEEDVSPWLERILTKAGVRIIFMDVDTSKTGEE